MRNRSVTYSPDTIFSALADPTRRAMLDLLRSGSLAAGEIAQSFPISRPAVSKHLRLLRQAHLVHERTSGRHHFYHLNPAPLQVAEQWLQPYRTFWPARLEDLKAFVEEQQVADTAPPSIKNRAAQPDKPKRRTK